MCRASWTIWFAMVRLWSASCAATWMRCAAETTDATLTTCSALKEYARVVVKGRAAARACALKVWSVACRVFAHEHYDGTRHWSLGLGIVMERGRVQLSTPLQLSTVEWQLYCMLDWHSVLESFLSGDRNDWKIFGDTKNGRGCNILLGKMNANNLFIK